MSAPASLLNRILTAQGANSTLRGDDLRSAGREVSALALGAGDAIMAVDEAGERIVGAALLADDRVCAVDCSRRLDNQPVLLVAGYVAGTVGIVLKADLARSLGAPHVHAVFLGEEGMNTANIHGCDVVTSLTPRRRLMAL
ncbi:hypothetical protein [Mycobacterium marinum]|uniref:hypothetical protein n=1 Tax=Mycobacterium marinum TaxID=1781 RepID=UPI0011400C59|nr:hypothetical protein [Mycobacterium marinum]